MWPTFYIPAQELELPPPPPPPPPDWYNNGCGHVAVFVPTNITGLAVGDFMLWVCVTNCGTDSSPNAALMPPEGWAVYSSDVARSNWNSTGCVIFYKLATSEDLNPATEHVAEFQSNQMLNSKWRYQVCSVTYAYRDIHPELPFGVVSASRGSSSADWKRIEPHRLMVGHDKCPTVLVAGSHRSPADLELWGAQSDQPLGPGLTDEALFSLDYVINAFCESFYIGHRREASDREGENWIPGETAGSSALDPGWDYYAMGVTTMSGYHARLVSGGFGGVSRHYIEYPVTLTEGEKYTFHLSRRGPYRSSPKGVGISYVDPDGIERGFGNYENSATAGTVLDPLADENAVWFRSLVYEGEDGVPSTTGATMMLHFTAQQSGVHKLRISVLKVVHLGAGVYDVDWEFEAPANDYRYVRNICFRRGFTSGYFQPTPAAPVFAGDEVSGAEGSGWHRFAYGDPDVTCPGGVSNHLQISLNHNVPLSPAVMQTWWNHGDTTGLTLNNRVYPVYVTSDDAGCSAVSSRPVMPRKDGDLSRYYFEVKSEDAKHFSFGVSTGSFGGGAQYRFYTWHGTANHANSGATNVVNIGRVTPVVGDIWGCMIDYIDKEIVFYRNGVELTRVDLLDTYGQANTTSSGKTGWDWPLYAYIDNMRYAWPFGWAHLTVNLAGPFEYQPAGTVAFDWAAG